MGHRRIAPALSPVVLGEAITAMVINDIKPFRNILYKGKAGKLMEPILNKKG